MSIAVGWIEMGDEEDVEALYIYKADWDGSIFENHGTEPNVDLVDGTVTWHFNPYSAPHYELTGASISGTFGDTPARDEPFVFIFAYDGTGVDCYAGFQIAAASDDQIPWIQMDTWVNKGLGLGGAFEGLLRMFPALKGSFPSVAASAFTGSDDPCIATFAIDLTADTMTAYLNGVVQNVDNYVFAGLNEAFTDAAWEGDVLVANIGFTPILGPGDNSWPGIGSANVGVPPSICGMALKRSIPDLDETVAWASYFGISI